jgi:hypothetical protein
MGKIRARSNPPTSKNPKFSEQFKQIWTKAEIPLELAQAFLVAIRKKGHKKQQELMENILIDIKLGQSVVQYALAAINKRE